MDIEGTYTLQASPEDVWKCLMDQQILRYATPGVERLEAQGENRYTVAMHIKYAPLRGSYQGQVIISDQRYPYQYRISVEGEGRQGPLSGEGLVSLRGEDENTVVAYRGTLNTGKLGALLPAPVVRGAAKLLIQQFFLALADQLRAAPPEPAIIQEELPGMPVIERPRGRIAVLPPTAAAQPGFLRSAVRQLGLGAGDPVAEEQWERRVRRFGFATMLLLLVWIGTKLPRR